ncbi:MAG TPA: SAM-dependent chlorinase/fluorinase [Burkholderiales bacterium]|nr:SAM-dependent chlorinase/fluorinase [Burkholderiales bacterium]
MIVLFTDFGPDDIYVGQVKAVLVQLAPPGTPIHDLLHRVPNFDAKAGAHLLAGLQARFPSGSLFLAVIDPGVGGVRDGVVLEADGKGYVGPDNGLLSVVAARAAKARTWRITWRPKALSASFHGRDLFAPVAAWLAAGSLAKDKLEETRGLNVRFGPDDLSEVIYIDHYGNVLTGLRAGNVSRRARIGAGGRKLAYARVFAEAPAGSAFWYEDSIGLVEIAVNGGSAAELMGMHVGDPIKVIA